MAGCSPEAGGSEFSFSQHAQQLEDGASADKRDLGGTQPMLSVTHDRPIEIYFLLPLNYTNEADILQI